MGQSGEFLCRFQRPLLKTDFSLMKNVQKTLAKCALIQMQLFKKNFLDRVWQYN